MNYGDVQWAWAPRAWPTTPGVLTRSEVITDTIARYVSGGRVARMKANVVRHLDVRYEYAVDGKAYVGTTFNRWPQLERQNVGRESRRYPVHATVTVHYDPADPSAAVIDTSLPLNAVSEMALGIVVAAVAFGYLLRTHLR